MACRTTGKGDALKSNASINLGWDDKLLLIMEEKMFTELLESLGQAKAIMKGKMKPGRVFKYNEPDVQAIRKKFNLSQSEFAILLGISIGTLRKWEQGRNKPGGPERLLLMLAAKHPETIMDTYLFACVSSTPIQV